MNERTQNRMNATSVAPITPASSGMLQRKCACGTNTMAGGECEECRKKPEASLHRSSTLAGRGERGEGEVPSIVHEVLRSPGQPLDPATRAFFEPRFGHDFSQVRVHTDARAAESAQAVNALAYTVGRDVVFSTGQFRPETSTGRKLLAHELTHTLQQDLSSTLMPIGLASVDSWGEREAEDIATAITAMQPNLSRPAFPGIRHDNRNVRRQLQRQSPGGGTRANSSCEIVCPSLASMRRSVEGVCRLAGEDSTACKTARTKLAGNEKRVADADCKCAIFDTPPPVPSCATAYTKATSFQTLIDLVRAAEAKLRTAGINSVKDQIHALRGVYYGTTWSLDFSVEKSTTRNEGFQRFTRPSEDPAKSGPPDVQKALDCGLFKALQDSQDMIDPSGRHVDFGHLIIALDARNDPGFASNIKYPVSTPLMNINIDLGGTGTELVTWIGDLGGGAGSLAVKRVAAPGTSASTVFTGSDYGGSINLEGDIAGSVVATASPSAVTAPSFAPGKGLSDVLQDYLSPAAPSPAWNKRATTFLTMNGGTFDASGALTNRVTLITAFAAKIQEFACNYLASRAKDKKITITDAKAAAASHVVSSSQEVATAFVDALEDSHKSGGKIEAKRFPSPTAGVAKACTKQLFAIELLGP